MPEIAGVVHEHGLPPSRPIHLHLFSDERLFPGVDLPKAVREFLELGDHDQYSCGHETGEQGRFRFRGFPATWSGRLILPNTWAIVETQRTPAGPQVVVLGAPVRDLVIDVEHLPHLSGRIVDAQHQPAGGAQVDGILKWSDRTYDGAGAFTGPDGRFELNMRQDNLDQITLDVVGHEALGSAHVVRKRAKIDSTFDLGDIVLVGGTTVRLHVTDATGKPIEGAAVFAEGFTPGTRTDVRGDCVLTDIPAVAKQMRIIARGCWGAALTLPVSGSDPHTIVLQPCNRLTIRVLGPAGRPPGAILLAISTGGEQRLFPDSQSDQTDKILPERIVGKWHGTWYDGTGKGEPRFAPDEGGILSIEAVVPGIPLRLRVGDALGRFVRELTIAPLGEREDRHEEIVLAQAIHPVAGVVRDENGVPVPGANVDAHVDHSVHTTTDAQGRFRFDPTFAETISLGVHKDGFALVRVRELRIPDPPADIEFTLEHGRRVRVSVVDALSRPVETGNLSVFDPTIQSGWPSRPLGPGLFEVVDLPSHDIELRLYLSGKQYEQRHDPHVAEARIEVPVHGRVIVAWSTDRPGEHVVQLVPADTTLGTLTSFESNKPSGEAVFEAVLPGDWSASLVDARPREKATATNAPPVPISVQPGATVRVELPR
jgi:hypothetical protein